MEFNIECTQTLIDRLDTYASDQDVHMGLPDHQCEAMTLIVLQWLIENKLIKIEVTSNG